MIHRESASVSTLALRSYARTLSAAQLDKIPSIAKTVTSILSDFSQPLTIGEIDYCVRQSGFKPTIHLMREVMARLVSDGVVACREETVTERCVRLKSKDFGTRPVGRSAFLYSFGSMVPFRTVSVSVPGYDPNASTMRTSAKRRRSKASKAGKARLTRVAAPVPVPAPAPVLRQDEISNLQDRIGKLESSVDLLEAMTDMLIRLTRAGH